jgi:hypothetical protein
MHTHKAGSNRCTQLSAAGKVLRGMLLRGCLMWRGVCVGAQGTAQQQRGSYCRVRLRCTHVYPPSSFKWQH